MWGLRMWGIRMWGIRMWGKAGLSAGSGIEGATDVGQTRLLWIDEGTASMLTVDDGTVRL